MGQGWLWGGIDGTTINVQSAKEGDISKTQEAPSARCPGALKSRAFERCLSSRLVCLPVPGFETGTPGDRTSDLFWEYYWPSLREVFSFMCRADAVAEVPCSE